MKRSEKNKYTKQKIIDSALEEFAEKSYNEASLNVICLKGNLSKGIIYHYFKDKDELYLNCLSMCFHALVEHLERIEVSHLSVEEALTKYFKARYTFFKENSVYQNIFYHTLMNPPHHLIEQIKEIRAPFQKLNIEILTQLLSTLKLNNDVTIEEIVVVFQEYHDFINTQFRAKEMSEDSLKNYEKRCLKTLKIMLYGVIERREIK